MSANVKVSREESEDPHDGKGIAVETKYIENLTAKEFSRELVRIIAENEGLSEKHIASRDTIMLDMSEMPIDESDYEA